ncbi:hypothetical protein V8E55_003289 [Tylopilus felleus]
MSKKYAIPSDLPVAYSLEALPSAKGAFVSQRQSCGLPKEWTLDELVELDYRVIEWDGCVPVAVLDAAGRVMTVLAGRPRGDDWEDVHTRMSSLMEHAGNQVQNARPERRGSFVSISTGVSYGGGQKAPSNLRHGNPLEQAVVDSFIEDKAFQRAAGFMSSAFAFYAPKLFQEYCDHLNPLFTRNPRLRKLFKNSIFPTATFNCGQRVVTYEHVDSTNVPFGFCAIFACGSYDPTQGGHLVLFDLGIVVQFPPGSTILVPSGTMRHGNVSIRPHETRQSFTQYCPGGLFRWVAYGFKPVKKSSAELKKRFEEAHEARCKRFTGLFSHIDELRSDRTTVFNLKSCT